MEIISAREFALATSTLNFRKNIRKPPVNNKIRAQKVRVIDETGKQIGILLTKEALQLAKERDLDLVQVTDKAEPPVCKIIDYGKYLYSQKKKERKKSKSKSSQVKGVRLGFNISDHDLQTKAKAAQRFLKAGDRVRIEMRLRGREKAHKDLARKKINKFIEMMEEKTEIEKESEIKKAPRGLTLMIRKK